MRPLLFFVVASLLFVACSSITIHEETVFQPKPSVTPETFPLDEVDLAVQSISVADSLTVNAWHLTQDTAEVTVLFFGGNGFYLVQSRGYLRALTRPRLTHCSGTTGATGAATVPPQPRQSEMML